MNSPDPIVAVTNEQVLPILLTPDEVATSSERSAAAAEASSRCNVEHPELPELLVEGCARLLAEVLVLEYRARVREYAVAEQLTDPPSPVTH